jgi:hypothetical protein
VIADGWQDVQIPAGQEGWPPLGHGTFTLYDSGVSGGSMDEAEVVDFGVIFFKYA